MSDQSHIEQPAKSDSTAVMAGAMQRAVNHLIERLDRAGITWCLLRNRDSIPWGLAEGKAICMMVEDHVSHKQLVRLLADFHPVQISSREDGLLTLFFPVSDRLLRVDVYTRDITWRGAVLLHNRDILKNRREDRGFLVASPIDQAFIAWFERLLRGKLKERYTTFISETIQAHPTAFRDRALEAFGPELTSRFLHMATSNTVEESMALAPAARRAVWFSSLRHHPVRTVGGAVRHARNAVRLRLRPPGMSVALLGPDGAGKSSLTTMLCDLSSKGLPFADVENVSFHRNMLPTVQMISRRLKLKNHSSRNSSDQPYAKPALNPLLWLTYYTYHAIDYWVSEVLWSRPRMANTMLLVHDRHPIEIFLDPRRYRYSGPMVFPRLISRIVPKPTMVLVLLAPPEVIQSRKQEVSFEETVNQLAACREFAVSTPNAFILDSAQPRVEVLRTAVAHITSAAAVRTAHNFDLTAQGRSADTDTPDRGIGVPDLAGSRPSADILVDLPPITIPASNTLRPNGTAHTSISTRVTLNPRDRRVSS